MRSVAIGRSFVMGAACTLVLGAAMSCPDTAAARQIKNNTRTNVNANVNHNRNVNVDRSRNTNVNVNRHVDVDVDVDDHRHPVATGVAIAATAAVVGSVVRSLPPSCSAVVVNGITYQQCGGAWYQPQYAGSSVTYVVVNSPQ